MNDFKGILLSENILDTVKTFGLLFYRNEEGFWPDFAGIKHDHTQEFYRSCSSFISKCPRTG